MHYIKTVIHQHRAIVYGIVLSLLIPIALPLVSPSFATVGTTIYVSPDGNDTSDGLTEGSAIQTVAEVMNRLAAYTTVVFLPGEYNIPAITTVKHSDVTFTSQTPRAAVFNMQGYFVVIADNVTFNGFVLDGQFVGGRAIRGKGSGASDYLRIQNCEIKRFTHHAIDIDGVDNVVEDCHIHHILAWNNGRVDAHGIVTTSSQNLTIRNCNIHQVSGDSFQAGRGAWENVTIENCHFWDAPLEEDMAGYSQGDIAGENAIDTKRGWRERGRVTVLHSDFHGFRSTYIGNAAAMNLKEAVEVLVDGCAIYDSHIGLRLRGKSSKSYLKMQPAIINSELHDNDIMVRHEDDLEYFKFLYNTIYNNNTLYVRAPSSTDWGANWATVNNLFIAVDSLPEEASNAAKGAENNLVMSQSDVDANNVPLQGGNSIEVVGQVPDWHEPQGRVLYDKNSTLRSSPSTVGAYESGGTPPPGPREDVNGDNVVDLLDVMACINVVLENGNDENADVNRNGSVDILDVLQIVNVILEK